MAKIILTLIFFSFLFVLSWCGVDLLPVGLHGRIYNRILFYNNKNLVEKHDMCFMTYIPWSYTIVFYLTIAKISWINMAWGKYRKISRYIAWLQCTVHLWEGWPRYALISHFVQELPFPLIFLHGTRGRSRVRAPGPAQEFFSIPPSSFIRCFFFSTFPTKGLKDFFFLSL